MDTAKIKYTWQEVERLGEIMAGNNTARKIDFDLYRRRPKQLVKPRKQLSETTIRNRQRAKAVNKGHVIVIAIFCCAILFSCIRYLQLQTELTLKEKQINNLRKTYSQLKKDNDAYENQIRSSVDLDIVERISIAHLGMKHPSYEEVVTYETEGTSYVRQYQDVPGT